MIFTIIISRKNTTKKQSYCLLILIVYATRLKQITSTKTSGKTKINLTTAINQKIVSFMIKQTRKSLVNSSMKQPVKL